MKQTCRPAGSECWKDRRKKCDIREKEMEMLRALLQKNLKHRHSKPTSIVRFVRELTASPHLIPRSKLGHLACQPPHSLKSHIPVMGREEQTEEREVLDSIFPDEITGSLPSYYPISQTNSLTPRNNRHLRNRIPRLHPPRNHRR